MRAAFASTAWDLRFTREFNAAFPGFHTDVHGLVAEEDEAGRFSYYVDCVEA